MNAMLGRGAQAVRPEEYNAMLRASLDAGRPPKPEPKVRMHREPDWFDQFMDPQLFRNIPRDQIPENMRPPLDVPDRAPEFYEDNWLRRVTGMGRPRG